jgi:hypothetical protein
MPRSSSRGGGGFRYGSRNAGFGPRSSFASTRPMPAQSSGYNSYSSATRPGMFSGFGSTIAHGMAFGAGSEVAHQAIRGIMGPRYDTVYLQQAQQVPANQN